MTDSSFNPYDWSSIAQVYQRLAERSVAPDQLFPWLADWSDLEKQLYEARANAFRATMADTTNSTAQARYHQLLTTIIPQAQRASWILIDKLLALDPGALPPELHEVVRQLRWERTLFREELLPLTVEIETTAQTYWSLVGGLTVAFDGATLTLDQVRARLTDPNRARREHAWRAMMERRLQDRDTLDTLFLDLLRKRQVLAHQAGYPDYRAYRWRELKRLDYTPQDCFALHESIASAFGPIAERLLIHRRQQLGIDTVRPWDTRVDPQGRAPLRPFPTAAALENGVARLFAAMDPEFGRLFTKLRSGWLDLEARPGKPPLMGYHELLPWSKQVVIVLSTTGMGDDVWILVHEAGHAFHALLAQDQQPFFWQLCPPLEFAEVASQTLELLALPYLEADRGGWYSREDAQRARFEHLAFVVERLLTCVASDALQHWIYTQAPETLDAAGIDRYWSQLQAQFGAGEDWDGIEAWRGVSWRFQSLLFVRPFYQIEYVFAYLGALQIMRHAVQNQTEALRCYREALALGNTRSVPDLYAAAGARFLLDEAAIIELAAFVAAQLEQTGG